MPLQKVGMLWAASTKPAAAFAAALSRNNASRMPTGMPMPQATVSAPPASISV